MAARWSKQKRPTGLAGMNEFLVHVCGPRGYELREPGSSEWIAIVNPIVEHPHSYTIVGWYWYGLGYNTFIRPCVTADEAKKQAWEAYKNSLKEGQNAK
jgi:hypothetical protein